MAGGGDGTVLAPVTLEGEHAVLRPVEEEDAPALWAASADTDVWPWMPYPMHGEDDMRRFVLAARARAADAAGLGLAVVARAVDRIVGLTGYWNVDAGHRRLEIGSTWLNRAWQRTAINTEIKYLMLRHAFEQLSCRRVEFKTDSRNVRSRAALRRIGAIEEGTLRHHMVLPDGRSRDSVYFSILATEWPGVRAHLEALLRRGGGASTR